MKDPMDWVMAFFVTCVGLMFVLAGAAFLVGALK